MEIYKIPVLKIGIKNHNLEIYNKETVNNIINDFNLKKNTGYILNGELVLKERKKDYNNILYDNVSHKIEKLYIEGNILYADIFILENENGVIALNMLESNLLALRPRTFSSTQDNFIDFKQLITFDLIRKENDSYQGLI